jgi:hypothetical protein
VWEALHQGTLRDICFAYKVLHGCVSGHWQFRYWLAHVSHSSIAPCALLLVPTFALGSGTTARFWRPRTI